MGGMPIAAVWDQDSFQWYDDTGGEGTGAKGAVNSNPTDLAAGSQYRLRYLVQETAGSNSSEQIQARLEFRVDPAGGTSFGAWGIAHTGNSYFDTVTSSNVSDGNSTTQQIGSGTLLDGEFVWNNSSVSFQSNISIATQGNDEQEYEYVILFDATNSDGANFEFRVTDNGTAFDTYTNTTQVLVGSGSPTTPQAVSGSVTPSGALGVTVQKGNTGSMTMTGDIVKQVNTSMSGSMTMVGALDTLKSIIMAVAGSLTPSGTLLEVFTATRSLDGSIAPSGLISKTIQLLKTGSITTTGDITKQVGVGVVGSMVMSGALDAVKSVLLTVTGSLTPVGDMTSRLSSTVDISGSLSASGDITKQTNITPAGSVTVEGATTKIVMKTLVGSITLSNTMTKLVTKVLDGSLTPSGTVAAAIVLLITITGQTVLTGLVNTLFVPAGTIVTWVFDRFTRLKSNLKSNFKSITEEKHD